jgi:hypothetical protein
MEFEKRAGDFAGVGRSMLRPYKFQKLFVAEGD